MTTRIELIETARSLDIAGPTNKSKQELIEAIEAAQLAQDKAKIEALNAANAELERAKQLEADWNDPRTTSRLKALDACIAGDIEKYQSTLDNFAQRLAKDGVRHVIKWDAEQAVQAEARIHELAMLQRFIMRCLDNQDRTVEEQYNQLRELADDYARRSLERMARGDNEGMNEGQYAAEAFLSLYLGQLLDSRNWDSEDFAYICTMI